MDEDGVEEIVERCRASNCSKTAVHHEPETTRLRLCNISTKTLWACVCLWSRPTANSSPYLPQPLTENYEQVPRVGKINSKVS